MDERRAQANIKKIPYGIADYEKIVTGHYYYVDKTAYLRSIEEVGNYLFLIRPRRFGKSLFLSVMETYYDTAREEQFDLFFKNTLIHSRPTGEKNKYLILKFNFSAVEPHPQKVEASFLNNVRSVARYFLHEYAGYLEERNREELRAGLSNMGSAADILLGIINLCRSSHQQLYIMIDEYDNFANTILSTSGSESYQHLTHGEGFFRAFFNVLKEGTTGSGAPISRLFITGVSPVTLDDVTSGFNIGKNISINPHFNEMLGFTRGDVNELIEYYRRTGLLPFSSGQLLDIMDQWYDHYLFAKQSTTRLYNPDMVLYFMDRCIQLQDIPDELIDRNVRIDYGKLRHLIVIDSDRGVLTNGNFSRLKQIIEEGEIETERLVEGFPVEELTDAKHFISLLFYLGLLTIKGVVDEEPLLCIPNETVRRLYYDYIRDAYKETETFSMDWYVFGRLIHAMAYRGEWRPLFDYIGQRMKASMGLRDLINGEASVRAFLNVYLGLSPLYIIHTERELNQGFADIVMEPFTARYREMKYAYILELKYMKKGESRKALAAVIQEAENQLRRYSLDERLKKNMAQTTLVRLVLVFSGTDLRYLGEVKE
jgi:hypothetical protein